MENKEQHERSAWGSIMGCKCPRCREGDIFINKYSYSYGFGKMHDYCPSCGFKYDMEQGFFYGAMYISYAIGVTITVPLVILLTWLTDLTIFQKTMICMGSLVLLLPVMFRYSRSAWLHIFVRKEEKKAGSDRYGKGE